MKYVLAVLILVAIWLPTAILAYKARQTQKMLDSTPALNDEFNTPELFTWVIGAFSLLATIFLLFGQIQNNWL